MHNVFASVKAELTDCAPGFSFFFDLVRKEWTGVNFAPLHRICTLMRKMGVRSLLREELTPDTEIESEIKSAEIRTGGSVKCKAVRFTFFRGLPTSLDWHELNADDILGYAVIVTLILPNEAPRSYILESVIRVPAIWDLSAGPLAICNYYVHCAREFSTTVGIADEHRDFSIIGSYFCQQNDLTHVCAHSALRVAINSSSVFGGVKLTNDEINQSLGIDHSQANHVGRLGTEQSVGLSMAQIKHVVQHRGWNVDAADFIANPAIDYEDYIFPLVESGCPVILGVLGHRTAHVVAVLGHTLNTDRWTPEARLGYGSYPISPYISGSAWADHFIVCDDNFGMYVTMPTEAIRNVLVPKYNPNLHASLAVGLVPGNVSVPGYLAEQTAVSVAAQLIMMTPAQTDDRWLNLLKQGPLVCRTLWRDKADYCASMASARDEQQHSLTAAESQTLDACLPPRFWVTEITLTNLYTGNKHKVGDIVTLADATAVQMANRDAVVFAWLPGRAWHGPALINQTNCSFTGHIPALRAATPAGACLEW